MTIWKKHKNLFKRKVGHYGSGKVKLRFKEKASKRHQRKPYGVAESHKKLMKYFLEDLCEQKVLRKADAAECLSPVFCKDKTGGGM